MSEVLDKCRETVNEYVRANGVKACRDQGKLLMRDGIGWMIAERKDHLHVSNNVPGDTHGPLLCAVTHDSVFARYFLTAR